MFHDDFCVVCLFLLFASVASIFPLSGPTDGSTALTITGNNFGVSASVKIGSTTCAPTSQSATRITCLTSIGNGINLPVFINVGGQNVTSTTGLLFSYAPPSLTSASPVVRPLVENAIEFVCYLSVS
jgi:hypothetical protein